MFKVHRRIFLKKIMQIFTFDGEKLKFIISKEENSDEILKPNNFKRVIPTAYGFKNVDLEDYFMELIGRQNMNKFF